MSALHHTELFYSIQGEGRYIGVPSVFLRMFGCNFRCKNFGRPNDTILNQNETHNPEVLDVIKNINQYKTFNELPLVNTGCDSYSSIYPEFKSFAIKHTASQVAAGMIDLLPFKEWRDEHLVITGGEPLLGWQRAYPELLDHPLMANLKEITFETNGTQELSTDFYNYLQQWKCERADREVTFSVSAKLSCSGESRTDALKPEFVCEYEDIGYTYLKFVVANNTDVEEAINTITVYRKHGFNGPVYLMPVGGTVESFNLTNLQVAELALQNGLRYSDRLHVRLFGNQWAT